VTSVSGWRLLTPTAGLVALSSFAVAFSERVALEETRAKLERAERHVERLRAATSTTSAAAPCVAPAAPPSGAPEALRERSRAEGSSSAGDADGEPPEEEPRSDVEVLFEYDQAFAAQVPERDFQRREETRLSRAIGLLLDRADRSDGVACRATMCRTRLRLADEAHYRAFMTRLDDSGPPWIGETMLRREPSDGGGVTLWLYYTAADPADSA
jgi:hypothetical protein